MDLDHKTCTCPDHENGHKCKHLYAVEFTVKREFGSDGTITETKTMTFTEKKTYKQNWPAYTLAQIEEKHRFRVLLHDLCAGVEPFPRKPGAGRTPVLASDAIFAAAFKVYSTVSTRRFACDLKDALQLGFISQKIHHNSICAYLENPELTPRLHALIRQSSYPLHSVEEEFAVDSTGFSTSRFARWFDEKYGATRQAHDWVKVHISNGCQSNIVAAVTITERYSGDSPEFKPLVEEMFRIKRVSADKAYLCLENMETVREHGGTPYIMFKSNSTGGAGGPGSIFERMFHYYQAHRDTYLKFYHKRSNVEATFSAIKRKFNELIRSRTNTAIVNEMLCKVLCHNICCVIQSQCELGIEVDFWPDEKPAGAGNQLVTEELNVN